MGGQPHDHRHLAGDERDLLLRAREELYHAKVVVRRERNSAKTSAAALDDSERRMDALIAEIEPRLNGSPDQEVQGHEQGEDKAARRHEVTLARS